MLTCCYPRSFYERPFRVRVIFLVATGFLMLFSFLLVGMGLTNVENAADTMSDSLTVSVEIFNRPAANYLQL
jgi:hypothetical protein